MRRPLEILTLVLATWVTGSGAQEPDSGAPNVDSKNSNVSWVTKYSTARHKSSDTNRPVMLFLTMDGCVHCTRMENDSFKDPEVIRDLNGAFIPAIVKTDMDSRLARGLKVNIFPTTVFIAPDGKILEYIRGYIPKSKLSLAMNRVMDTSAASVASRPTP